MSEAQLVLLATRLLGIVLDLIGVARAKELLDQASVSRGVALADAAELAKFGP